MKNKYFNFFSYPREQDLVEDLILETIKIHGLDVKYIPRSRTSEDFLYGEDRLSMFSQAADVEVYIKNVEGFEGEQTFLSKFGLEIRDQITFTLARKRFDQIATEKVMTEVGYNLLVETANTNHPSRQFLSQSKYSGMIELEDGNGDNYSITSNRPQEGDLIFLPLTEKLYEHESVFYQTGRLQTYDLKCEQFQYSSERFETGNTTIDAIEDRYTQDVLNYQLLDETGANVGIESDGTVLIEYRIEDTVKGANNEFFTIKSKTIFDFSERNPFGESEY